ncbi:M14 family metallopeptidase [Arenibacter sp. M-2]|uniref:M14 family metallopeptidase n=1 Tax=unclassified Arenibacter TaxID=2615047 RepID=UPI000D7513F8|nr:MULTISPECIES: M14 family metallopeptidase [unclassified Arenibacter]MDL5511438.1 M14 family metallopeptidase [Arenibacter sp. M-2]PXX24253.1 zinc carboxypeptidase [Arenibacter sp. ARW7G5Y1]
MKKLLLSFFLLSTSLGISQKLLSPSEFLGYELGTEFTRHHQVVDYYKYLAENASDRVKLVEYGKTNERRPLIVAFVSTSENMANLESIRLEHMMNTTGQGSPTKAVVWLSYNVHGNESVSSEASMQTTYELLTSKSAYLENTVVIIDPCINPDGRDRYVNWYNQFKNTPHNIDPNSKEHHEGWLNGRSNHYMFDLNRDWAWLTQIESQQRIKVFNQWLPHVHVDFHEQGVNNPYYFAPAAEPFHEVVTDFQRDFQITIGKNHAKYFDANGWFYFTKEVFDLLYPSYGDTYPTYNGGIGMTYEQGGSGRAGLGVRTFIGDTLTLHDRIAHHLTTGLSTVEVASKNTEKLNREFKKFYQEKSFKYKSYVMNGDPDKIDALANLLRSHEIKYGWAKEGTAKGHLYSSGKLGSIKTTPSSLVVSSDQTKGTLAQVLLEPSTKLSDSLTYDITAWSLPYAYGLEAIASQALVESVPSGDWEIFPPMSANINLDTYAYISDWSSMKDARFLTALLNENIRVRFAKNPFRAEGKKFDRGSLIITKGDNKNHKDFLETLSRVANNTRTILTPANTGFVEKGNDFGSSYVPMITDTKIAMLSGEPVSTLEFGEIWHFFEQQLHYPLTILDTEYYDEVDLSEYDVLILPNGWYSQFFTKEKRQELKDFVSNGGKLIAMEGAIKGINGENGFAIKEKETKKDSTENILPYEDAERENIKNAITGAIFKTKVDQTHPLAYGYGDRYFTLKLSDDAFEKLETGTVVYLENANSKVAGFAGSEAKKKIANTMVFGVEEVGKGQVIYMVDNPLFRGFWENGKLFFVNALFMVK